MTYEELIKELIEKEMTMQDEYISNSHISKILKEDLSDFWREKTRDDLIWREKGKRLAAKDMETSFLVEGLVRIFNHLQQKKYTSFVLVDEARAILKCMIEEWGHRSDITEDQWNSIQMILGVIKKWN